MAALLHCSAVPKSADRFVHVGSSRLLINGSHHPAMRIGRIMPILLVDCQKVGVRSTNRHAHADVRNSYVDDTANVAIATALSRVSDLGRAVLSPSTIACRTLAIRAHWQQPVSQVTSSKHIGSWVMP